jgi:predicted small metal-binding protein
LLISHFSERACRDSGLIFPIGGGKEAVTVAEKLKKIECDPKCGFLVQSHDEKEIVEIALQHAKKAHSMNITQKDVKGMMKDA